MNGAVKDFLGNPDHLRQVIVVGAALIAFLFAVGVLQVVGWVTDPARRRLGGLAPERQSGRSAEAFVAWVHRAAHYVLPKSGTERANIHRQLIHAGSRSNNAL